MNNDAYPIITMPNPVLREKAQPVARVDDTIKSMFRRMEKTLELSESGIGLAANQVGLLHRMFIIDLGDGVHKYNMTNPEIIWSEPDLKFTYHEGCLSIPGHYADVARPQKIRIKFLDESNQEQEIEAEDLLSQVIQHELDHLNGVLFIDHLSRLKRDVILRKIEKEARLAGGVM